MTARRGTRLGGRYLLAERLAVGGMGEVWRGTDEILDRQVAVKILRPELGDDDAFRRRFRAEARTAGALSHAGIAAVYDYGEAQPGGPGNDGSGIAYLVMELVPGEALSSVLSRDGSLGTDRTLAIVAQASRALHAAHLHGVIHRDVKPANLMVTPDGQVKVTDFGIARPRDHEPLTMTGQVMGTAHYLAPELARGQPASPLSDVYALGVVAYECLAGRRPFEGDNQVAVATAHLAEEPPPLPPTIAIEVRRVVAAAMEKEPARRVPNAEALADTLDGLRRRDIVRGGLSTQVLPRGYAGQQATGGVTGSSGSAFRGYNSPGPTGSGFTGSAAGNGTGIGSSAGFAPAGETAADGTAAGLGANGLVGAGLTGEALADGITEVAAQPAQMRLTRPRNRARGGGPTPPDAGTSSGGGLAPPAPGGRLPADATADGPQTPLGQVRTNAFGSVHGPNMPRGPADPNATALIGDSGGQGISGHDVSLVRGSGGPNTPTGLRARPLRRKPPLALVALAGIAASVIIGGLVALLNSGSTQHSPTTQVTPSQTSRSSVGIPSTRPSTRPSSGRTTRPTVARTSTRVTPVAPASIAKTTPKISTSTVPTKTVTPTPTPTPTPSGTPSDTPTTPTDPPPPA